MLAGRVRACLPTLPRPLDLISLGADAAAARGVNVAASRADRADQRVAGDRRGGLDRRPGLVHRPGRAASRPAGRRVRSPARAAGVGTVRRGISDRLRLVARTVFAPVELPVGIVTALIGGPFFLWLLLRRIAMSTIQARLACARGGGRSCSLAAADQARAAAPDRVADPGGDRDDLRDGRRRSGSSASAATTIFRREVSRIAAGGRAARSGRRAHPRAEAGSRGRLRHTDRAEAAAGSRRHPYYSYEHRALPDITDDIRAIGARIGSAAQANAAGRRHGAQALAAIRAKSVGWPRPRTMLVFERDPVRRCATSTRAAATDFSTTCWVAGGGNVFADVKQQSVRSARRLILARQPDVIVELRYGDSVRALDLPRRAASVERARVGAGGPKPPGLRAGRRRVRRPGPARRRRDATARANPSSREIPVSP